MPRILEECVAYFESTECADTLARNGASKPRCIGMHYANDKIELRYNMSLRNHSSTFQLVYDQITQECTIAVQFLGQARNRWEQIALLAGISPGLSGLNLDGDVTLDRSAGIVSWSWRITHKDELSLIAQYLGTMATLSFERDLETNMLSNLHRGSTPLEYALKTALADYQNQYGAGSITEWLMEALLQNSL